MTNRPIQELFINEQKEDGNNDKSKRGHHFFATAFKPTRLLFLIVLLFLGSLVVDFHQPDVYAIAVNASGNTCHWYKVHPGDTLSGIASQYRMNVWTLAQANHVSNVNVIFAYQYLCIPYRVQSSCSAGCSGMYSGVLASGVVRWYEYGALERSTPRQVEITLRQAAAYYHLPTSLLLAIAWQESGWEQHVISRDGGIGIMQIMPYTAMSINAATGVRRDPYKLQDNVYLGASYLSSLWINFHGNTSLVISAYNEGGWAVAHQGIFNWGYVNNVYYLMNVLR